MIEITIEPETLAKALKRHQRAGGAFKGASIKGGKGRFWGYLCEEIVLQYLGDEAVLKDTFDYDLIYKGYKFDVKGKSHPGKPQKYWDVSVDASCRNQKNDAYIFVRVVGPKANESKSFIENYEYKTAYILGCCSREDFYESARFYTKGEKDLGNGHIYKEDVWVMKIKELDNFMELKEIT